ncbi:MAG: S41 family peptidase [bacterium]|jgi:C-terminal processing protease CtpA/Prc
MSGWQMYRRFLPRGWGLCLFVWWHALPVVGGESLDEILYGLETNGILGDRSAAVLGGLKGILQSIDSEVTLCATNPSVAEAGLSSSVVQAVELWPENLAYLKVSGLETGSGDEILAHLKSLSDRGGVLFDLRGGGGQDLNSVCVLAGLTRSQNEPLFVITDNRGVALSTNSVGGEYFKLPLLLVLIDAATCGASEALVSVLKGSPGVMLVGSPTKGDPYLRNWFPLPGGKIVRIATQKWLPVSGGMYQKIGIRPDIMVEAAAGIGGAGLSRTNRFARALSPKSDADQELMMRVAGDAALQRATDILLGLQAVGGYGQD